MIFVRMNKHTKSQSGNILFLILIAVALFAALSYVVVRSSRSGAGNTEAENDRLEASRVLNYVTAVQAAVVRLQLSGCTDAQISFEDELLDSGSIGIGATYVNPNAPTDDHCHVFRAKGGGVPVEIPKLNKMDATLYPYYYFSGSDALTDVGTTCTDPSCGDLAFSLWGVSVGLCKALNDLSGVGYLNSSIPNDVFQGCPFAGTYDCTGDGTAKVAFTDPLLKGKLAACFYSSTFNVYAYASVLHAR